MTKHLFITGTGTDIGKTFVSALIVKKLHESGARSAYYKAAMSGNDRRPDGRLIPGDAAYVQEISGIDQSLESMCPFVYETAVSPHLASKLEGNPVSLDKVFEGLDAVDQDYDYVTSEGSGGILCPLRYDGETILLEDVIKGRNMPCLIVADAGLGTINDVVLTVRYMEAEKISIKGIIFNHYLPGDTMQEDNRKMVEELTGIPVVACVRKGDRDLDMDVDLLKSFYE